MTSRFVLLSCWYASCAVLLALAVKSCGGSLKGTTRQSIVASQGHQDTTHKLGQDQAPDEAWQRAQEGRVMGSQNAAGPAPSLNPSQSLDSMLQGMQRQQDLKLQDTLFGHRR